MFAVIFIDRYDLQLKHTLAVSRVFHTFITFVVSFLLLSRVRNGLERYNRASECLSIMYRESRELIQSVCALSADSTDASAKEWRHEVAYRCLVMLRTAMAVIDYPAMRTPSWEVSELNGFELDFVMGNLLLGDDTSSAVVRWAHTRHGVWEETMRVPVRLEYLLLKSLHSQSRRLKIPIVVSQESRLLNYVSKFMSGYVGIQKFLTTVRLPVMLGFFLLLAF